MNTHTQPVRAKIFQNGGSQAVRLPKKFRFANQDEVLIRQEGSRLILESVNEWPDTFRSCLGAWHDDIPRPEQGDIMDPFI